jgi:methenyltetrahydrofolate cyclohydrolase
MPRAELSGSSSVVIHKFGVQFMNHDTTNELVGLPFGRLLEALGARTPAPGGGTGAALTGALAASLVEMAARFSLPREGSIETRQRMEEILERAGELREQLLSLAEVELHAYEPVLAARAIAKDDPERQRRLRAARSAAAQSPVEIASAATDLAELAAELVRTGNPNLEGDALTGCLLAEAVCRSAAGLVEINLLDEADDLRLRWAGDLARRALAARESALGGSAE